MSDDFDLDRFVTAQASGSTYDAALGELRSGRKRSHWMWFVFPQVAGLGSSPAAVHFALTGREEARAYAAHPLLGPRLRECAQVLVDSGETDPVRLLGGIDAIKLRSSMTLFAAAVPDEPLFQQVLDQFFDGVADEETLRRL